MEQFNIELDYEHEIDIANILENFMLDRYNYYHICVWKDKITVEEQGYNTPTIKKIAFDITKLANNDGQIKNVISEIYQCAFNKNQDLEHRINMIKSNPNADSHWGASHTFYHDRTGLYPEYVIVDAILLLNIEENDNNYTFY